MRPRATSAPEKPTHPYSERLTCPARSTSRAASSSVQAKLGIPKIFSQGNELLIRRTSLRSKHDPIFGQQDVRPEGPRKQGRRQFPHRNGLNSYIFNNNPSPGRHLSQRKRQSIDISIRSMQAVVNNKIKIIIRNQLTQPRQSLRIQLINRKGFNPILLKQDTIIDVGPIDLSVRQKIPKSPERSAWTTTCAHI